MSVSEKLKRLAELEALLNRPEIEDFIKGVQTEAAHQKVRWGQGHDLTKEAEDWFWTLGYLAGKALLSFRAGDLDKAKHHLITTAALTANWFESIKTK
jgi:hypothetical protein